MMFYDFIYISLFQSKGQNSLFESDEYFSYKLINYSFSVKYLKIQSQIWKLEPLSFQMIVKITLGSD